MRRHRPRSRRINRTRAFVDIGLVFARRLSKCSDNCRRRMRANSFRRAVLIRRLRIPVSTRVSSSCLTSSSSTIFTLDAISTPRFFTLGREYHGLQPSLLCNKMGCDGLCTKNTSWALIERPYSCAPQAVGAVYDRPGFFVQSRLTASWHSNDESCSAGTTGKPRRPQICAGLSRPGSETRPCRDSREGSLLQLPRRVHCTWHA